VQQLPIGDFLETGWTAKFHMDSFNNALPTAELLMSGIAL
jgi:hypothetical protein